MKQYEAIIIGSGQGGTPLAMKLAQQGWNVALVEKQYAGGTCVNVGCTPTKTMIASAKVAYTVAQAGKWGVEVNDFKLHLPAVLERKRKVVESFRQGSEKGMEETENLCFIRGEASFIDRKTLRVTLKDGGEETLSANKIFIDVGTRAALPDVAGLRETDYLTSTTLLELEEVPERLIILGGGYIGLEFGQMYRRFGSQVTILDHNQRLLPREDEDIAAEVLKFLEAEGIQVITGAQTTKVQKEGKYLNVTLKIGDEERIITGSHILVSAGRTPNTDTLNLPAAGVELDKRGYIKANDRLETSAPGIYAIGDVKGGPAFTHISYNDYLILYENLVEGKNDSIQNRMVPYTMFTDPQLGRVGITEQEARKSNLNIKVATLPMAHVARAIEIGDTRGMMKAIVDAGTGKILGVAIVGQEGGEVMSVLQMAMVGNVTWRQIKDMVFAHPLYAESLNTLFMKLEKEE
ncbi:mercuric reductase [Rufibacter tibetensis]|uniref:Mercuric reductase n=1 Tax=Rufibacter tibetensis TaxID=512763 RepID=A0A0P0C6U6_9BACT|nr:mercuric reductase [Rufibacter tibetensis]ALJ00996.1 mercuric reductase [Rufibacter tibetensis]